MKADDERISDEGQPGRPAAEDWFVYIVECSDKSFYTGITTDIKRRVDEHNAGKGARYTRSRRPVVIRYQELHLDRSHASAREYRIKALSRAGKQELIENGRGRKRGGV